LLYTLFAGKKLARIGGEPPGKPKTGDTTMRINYTCKHAHNLHVGCSVAVARLAAMTTEPKHLYVDGTPDNPVCGEYVLIGGERMGYTDPLGGVVYALTGPLDVGSPHTVESLACSTHLDGVFGTRGTVGLY
jgi:hypothetical protein